MRCWNIVRSLRFFDAQDRVQSNVPLPDIARLLLASRKRFLGRAQTHTHTHIHFLSLSLSCCCSRNKIAASSVSFVRFSRSAVLSLDKARLKPNRAHRWEIDRSRRAVIGVLRGDIKSIRYGVTRGVIRGRRWWWSSSARIPASPHNPHNLI